MKTPALPPSSRRPSALVVAPNVPRPPRTYSYQVVVAKLQALTKRFDVLFCTGVWDAAQATALGELGREIGCGVAGIEAPAMLGQMRRAGGKLLSLAQSAATGVPAGRLQVCHPRLRRHLRHLVATRRFDLIQVDYWYMGLGWLPPASPTVCYAHDLDFLRAASAATAGGGHQLSAAKSERLRSVELRALSGYRAVAAISPVEAEHLRQVLPIRIRVAALPAGVEARQLRVPPSGACRRVLFVGALGSGPNADAVLWLVRDIWPKVLAQVPDAALSIVGGGIGAELRAASRLPGVELVGEVDNMAAQYERCVAVVAPLRWGSGMKGKVLEALASGRALVATPVALEGIDARDGQECLVAHDAQGIARGIVRVLEQPTIACSLATAGRHMVQERYERSACMRAYLAFVEEVVESGGGRDG